MATPVSTRLALIGQQSGETGRAQKYKPEWCAAVSDMAQSGMFPEEWCARLGVTLETLRLWGHRHPEFRDTLIVARHLLNAYWSAKARASINDKSANAAILITVLKGRFPEFYGNNPADLWHFLHSADGSWRAEAPTDAVGLNRRLSADEIQTKLAALRARREAEGRH